MVIPSLTLMPILISLYQETDNVIYTDIYMSTILALPQPNQIRSDHVGAGHSTSTSSTPPISDIP